MRIAVAVYRPSRFGPRKSDQLTLGARGATGARGARGASAPKKNVPVAQGFSPAKKDPAVDHAERKRQQAEQRKREQGAKKIQTTISNLEAKIAQHEQAMKEIEAAMAAPGFYENRDQAQPLIDRHQTLMWELGELLHQWEELSKDL